MSLRELEISQNYLHTGLAVNRRLPYEISVISIGRALAILQSEYNEIERRLSGDVSRLSIKLEITIMSGVEDGLQLSYAPENGDGQTDAEGKWLVSVGRREDSDICLRNDTFVSRLHAYVYWDSDHWWLQDCDSTNGTFLEHSDSDARVKGTIPISAGVLFRIGHTWMRIEANE